MTVDTDPAALDAAVAGRCGRRRRLSAATVFHDSNATTCSECALNKRADRLALTPQFAMLNWAFVVWSSGDVRGYERPRRPSLDVIQHQRVSGVALNFLTWEDGCGPLGLLGPGYGQPVAILGDLKKQPRMYAPRGTWPDGALEADAPAEAEVAQHISRVLRDFCEARKLSSYKAAAAAGMTQGAIYNVLSGRAWPNSGVVARIERSLGVVLWPTLHNPDLEPTPRHYLYSGQWPFGALEPSAPTEAEIALKISEQFHRAFRPFRRRRRRRRAAADLTGRRRGAP